MYAQWRVYICNNLPANALPQSYGRYKAVRRLPRILHMHGSTFIRYYGEIQRSIGKKMANVIYDSGMISRYQELWDQIVNGPLDGK